MKVFRTNDVETSGKWVAKSNSQLVVFSVHLEISPRLNSQNVKKPFPPDWKLPPPQVSNPASKYDDAAEGMELVFLRLNIPCGVNASIEMLPWSGGLILPPCQRLLFCRLARSVSMPRRHIQLFATFSHTWHGSRSTHMTSPICHSLIPCPPVEKHCSYKYWMYLEGGGRTCQTALTLISKWSPIVNKILFHEVRQQWRRCD